MFPKAAPKSVPPLATDFSILGDPVSWMAQSWQSINHSHP